MKSFVLRIDDFRVQSHIGWAEEERLCAQELSVSCEIFWPLEPSACMSDELNETLCYTKVLDAAQEICETVRVRTLEKLLQMLINKISELAVGATKISVSVHKVKPPVKQRVARLVCELKSEMTESM